MDTLNINDPHLWKDLGIDNPSEDLNENIVKFYREYSKIISNWIGERRFDDAISIISGEIRRDPFFLMKVFLAKEESKMKTPKIYQ